MRPELSIYTHLITADAYESEGMAALGIAFKFKCNHCGRGFDSKHGCSIHAAR